MSVLDWLYVLTVAPFILALALVVLIAAAIVIRHRENKAYLAELVAAGKAAERDTDDIPTEALNRIREAVNEYDAATNPATEI